MVTKRTQVIGIFGLLALLLSSLVFAALLYGISSRKGLIEERARAWVAAEERRTQLSSLIDLVAETEESRGRLSSYVLTNEAVIDFLALIERVARDIGLGIETKSLNVEPLEGSSVFESLALTVEVSGPYDTVARMSSIIETLPYQVFVRKVSIDRTGSDQLGREQWRGLFDIRVTKYK